MTRARILLASLLLCLSLPTLAQDGDTLVIGVFPRHNYTETYRMFTPMVKYLNSRLDFKVRLETTRDFDTFWANVTQRRYDLVHFNQYQYLRAHENVGYQIILKNEEFGSATISSIIMVRKDSGINTLQDLKGKKVVFGGSQSAMMSYLIPRHLLREAGLADNSYESEFAHNPPNALMAVALGRADACGIGDAIPKEPSMAQRVNLSELKIIASSARYPQLAWAVSPKLDSKRINALTQLLLELNNTPEGKDILHHAKMTGLLTATPAEYAPLTQYIEKTK